MHEDAGPGFLRGSIKTYGKAVRLIAEVWQRVTGAEMQTLSGSPSERFAMALALLEAELKKVKEAPSARTALHTASSADPELQEFIDDILMDDTPEILADIDDVSPNAFKSAAYRCVEENFSSQSIFDIPLEDILRWIATDLKKQFGWSRRINIGQNRHFPRMLLWMRELEADTTWNEGVGFKLLNASGKGAVAKMPSSPRNLKVRINPDFL